MVLEARTAPPRFRHPVNDLYALCQNGPVMELAKDGYRHIPRPRSAACSSASGTCPRSPDAVVSRYDTTAMEVTMWPGTLIRYAIVGLALALVGCATMQNTPKQEYVWSCIEACKAEIPPQCQIVGVNMEGGTSSSCVGTLANWDKFSGCMQREYDKRPYAAWLKERAK